MKFGSLRFALVLLCAPSLLTVACSAPSAPSSSQPPDWDAELRIPDAVDTNPDPHIFETTLTATIANLELRPGIVTPVWTYNGQLPGPMIRVARGDRLIVHLKNELPEATTIHWHGIRLPNDMDGVPGASQPAVEPGGGFDYDFIVPDAGTFWYHPHVDSAAEVGFGMYGPLIVTDPHEPAGLGDELVLVLSDIMLKPDGTQLEADAGGPLTTLFGREGDTLLVNGKVNPTLHAKAGRRQRWRIINAAKSRYYQVELAGQQFTRFGGDDGLIAAPENLDAIVLTPAQRADVSFELAMPENTSLPVRWVPYERGFGTKIYRPEEHMFTIQTSTDVPELSAPLPPLQRDIEMIDVSNATPQHFDLTQSEPGQPFSLGINGVPGDQAPPVMVTMGDTQIWTVKNTMAWAHPFHLHGFFFQVVDVNGEAPALREWRDTTNIPVDAVVRIAVKFDERPGMWMFHCHILDHADAGMMGMVMLHPGPTRSP